MGKNKKDDEEMPQHSAAQLEDGEEEEELWREMAFAQESSKVTVENSQARDLKEKQVEDCEHAFIYKDDTGEVCCVCGLIKKPIESMIEVVFSEVDEVSSN